MKKTVVYLTTKHADLPNLLVSLYSLRRWWEGDIIVYSYPEVLHIVREIAVDKRLAFDYQRYEPVYIGTSGEEMSQQHVAMSVDSDYLVFLSNSTLVRGHIHDLFDSCLKGFAATQSHQQWTTDKEYQSAAVALLAVKDIDDCLVHKCLSTGSPRVRTGVFGCMPSSNILRRWNDLTSLAKDIPNADSLTLQLLMLDNKNEVNILSSNWNSDPVTRKDNLDDVVIWNFDNDSQSRPNICPKAVSIWYPLWESCRMTNVGFVNNWIDQVLPYTKYLSQINC